MINNPRIKSWSSQWVGELDNELYHFRQETSLTYIRNIMLSFSIQLLVLIGAEWCEIRRYDTAHGQPHVHIFNIKGGERIADVEGSDTWGMFDSAMKEVEEGHERWLKYYLQSRN